MSVSIISCPSCKTLVLSDTHQCPTCKHVLNKEAADEAPPDLPAVVRASEDEIACPDCGEQVRSGLVRCWRCGGFLREDIAESYQKMLESPQKVVFSDEAGADSPEDEAATGEGTESTTTGQAADDEDDFELADGLNMMTQEELEQIQGSAPATAPAADEAGSSSSGDSSGSPGTAEQDAADAPESPAEEAKQEKDAEEPRPTGDPLLDIALQEQQEVQKRRKERKKKKVSGERAAMPGFVFVFCPNGHRIQVEERYRGQTGRCPRCKSLFHVPGIDWDARRRAEQEAAEADKKESLFKTWQLDVRLHQVDPTTLKLKPGSLEREYQEVDLGYSADKFIVVAHGKQGAGLFAGEKNKKKKEEFRNEVQEHLRLEKEILDLPAAGYRLFEQQDMENITVVQPAAYAHESMFAGVPVFGTGRIAVRLPVTDQDKDVKDILFVSFWLTEFREFGGHLEELYGVKDLGQLEGVPLTDSDSTYQCHYSDRQIKAIEVTDFHKVDPEIDLEIVGRKCAACSLVVSEESRKKEKLGGVSGKSIAKAKCPKCKAKFGDTTLYAIKEPDKEEEGLSETGGLNA